MQMQQVWFPNRDRKRKMVAHLPLSPMKNLMKARRMKAISTAFVMFCAWLAISNHCALATAAPAAVTNRAAEGCPYHQAKSSAPKPKPSQDAPCCKILRATLVTPAKNLARVAPNILPADFTFITFAVVAPPKLSFASATLDTGPPGGRSFAELILQRSILSHAPPVPA
jgi:hypothetical protein